MRTHKNTSRLTAKERATDLANALGRGDFEIHDEQAFNYDLFTAVAQGAIADHARETLARHKRREAK